MSSREGDQPPGWRRESLIVRGHALEFGSCGSGEPPVMLLHEGLGSIAAWRDFPARLARRVHRRVMAYSRAGHGQSDEPIVPRTPRFMHEEAIDWLPELLDGAGVDRAVLLGHSDGASIALIFAATYPARTIALILEAPHVFVEDVSIASIQRIKVEYDTTELRQRLARYHANVDAAFRGWNDVWLDPAFRTWNLEPYLPRITCPVLLIQGEQDEYGTLRQVEAVAGQVRGPVRTLILPDCGHSPHRDQPERTLEAITAFVSPETAPRSREESPA